MPSKPTAPAIKICGIATPQALDAAIKARADYIGLVFFAKSPRNVSLRDAALLGERASGRTKVVGLFVDALDATIAEAVVAARLDVIQVHGTETPQRVAQLRAQYGLPVWKALSVASRDDVVNAAAFAGAADMILFDAKAPKGADLPGGLGLVFDWDLLSAYRGEAPWGLAGGLSPDNVADAVRRTGTALVDVSSGVESAPGVKDADRIRTFCFNARNA
ncbi:MAG: N-(5'-phosphoribosyl)anthranilate isomerase [Novosphingobium sp. 32-60-15]|uniref:phosphoribosylanthranilate isomerase n=1 Tax=unclassified Novosphingobium TaxID=2644732 RepID=UPI000BC8E050|nr:MULTISPECIES: phosphoribosylanthranilate isomerase [unclassified Novosphingobium]OYX61384.1 MAG: N-(5'-phosphoribosyl)anthranilate isomerase [Novosphingobium sp. 32-60-15]